MASTSLEIILSARDNASGSINRVAGSLNSLNASAGRVGRGVGQVGAGLLRVGAIAGTVAAGGLVGAAKAAIDFEDAFAGVKKTVDEADLKKAGLSFDKLARSFRDMATEIPIAATEFARIGESAGALGIAAQDIDDFTKVVALMGVTTNLTTEAAAEGMGKLGTILGLTGDDFAELADSIVALGNKGASTEVEIVEMSKRFAAAGRQAGLAKEDIVALASAAASMGIEAEAGGGALSRIFANIASDIALATGEGVAFAEITGQSLKSLTEQVRQGKSLDIFIDFLEAIGKLDRIEAAKALKAAGITNVRDRDAVLKMAQNIGFLNEQLQISTKAAGALETEAGKRFDTVASKIQLLKNNFMEAAITVGEGFTPAVGRAATKLAEFLKLPGTRTELTKLGQDIGRFIDGINWADVLAGAREFVDIVKVAAGFAEKLVGAFMSLPEDVRKAAAAFVVLNKLSGGLIGAGAGNIIGGLGGAAVRGVGARIPGIGAVFAQPVFVTNWAMMGGGLGGAAGGAGAAAGGSKFGLAAIVAGVLGAVVVEEAIASNVRRAIGVPASVEELTANVPAGSDLRKPFWERQGFRWPWEAAPTPWVPSRPGGEVRGGAIERNRSIDPFSRFTPADITMNAAAAARHGELSSLLAGGGLASFRKDALGSGLFGERVDYLRGAQGRGDTGAKGKQFDEVVSRDIQALKAQQIGAATEQKAKLQKMIDTLVEIRDKEEFPNTITPAEAATLVNQGLAAVRTAIAALTLPTPTVTVPISVNISTREIDRARTVISRAGRVVAV